jgi:hypothetical protein
MGSKGSNVFRKYIDSVGVVDRAVNAGLGAWGALVAARPVLTIIVSSVVALALSGGMVLIGQRIETDGEDLWCAPVQRHVSMNSLAMLDGNCTE